MRVRARTDSAGGHRQAVCHFAAPLMIGRVEELDDIVSAATAPPAVVFVAGEAGIGKTRLIHEFLAADDVMATRTFVSGCHPMREPFPYGPVLELLREIDFRHTEHPLNAVTGALRGYLPELAESLPRAPEPLGDPLAERHRLFRAVRELIVALGPAVLVIEDLHWADDGSRELLRFLADAPPPQATFVLTYRGEDLPVPALPLGTAYRPPPAVTHARIDLTPLDVTEVGGLASAILDEATLAPGFAQQLHQHSAGIPFVLEELVRTIAADPAALRDTPDEPLEHFEVPVLLREALADRMAKLSEPAIATIHAASVLRMPSSGALLAEVAEDDDPSQSAIAEALRCGVLCEFDGSSYGFRHVLAQQAVYDTLDGPTRQRLHRLAAAALERFDPRPLVRLAYHANHAGDIADWVRYTEQAADHAMTVGDNAVALQVLESALSDNAVPNAARGELAVKLSRAAITGLSYHRALSLLTAVLSTEDLPAASRGEVRLNLGLLRSNQVGDNTQGRADMERAVSELADRPALAARGMSALALPAWGDIALQVHQRWLAAAERLCTGQDDTALTAAVVCDRITLLSCTGDPHWRREAERLPAHAASVAERHHVARAYGNLADSAVWLGHYAVAERYHRSGRQLAIDSGAPFLSGTIDATSLRLDWARGDWEGLDERGRHMIEMTADAPWIAADARFVVASLAIARGDWDEALGQLHAITTLGADNAPSSVLPAASGALARVHTATGDLVAARTEADRAIARLRRKGVWVWAAELAPSAVAVLTRMGELNEAESFTAEFGTGVTGRDAPHAHAAHEGCRAILRAARAQYVEAAESFTQARCSYQEMPRPYSAARAGEAAIRSRMAAGEHIAASELPAVADEFGALGATRDAARCRQLLRGTGIVTPSRRGRRGYGAHLSPREHEVASLLARDKTNREIAQVMFLSPRTVEQHVARVIRKLGVRSRDAVAGALAAGVAEGRDSSSRPLAG